MFPRWLIENFYVKQKNIEYWFLRTTLYIYVITLFPIIYYSPCQLIFLPNRSFYTGEKKLFRLKGKLQQKTLKIVWNEKKENNQNDTAVDIIHYMRIDQPWNLCLLSHKIRILLIWHEGVKYLKSDLVFWKVYWGVSGYINIIIELII